MDVIERAQVDGPRSEVLAVVVANVVPLVGVLAFGWRAATLVTIYWFELAVMIFWALVRALFAGRPSDFDREALILGVLADRSAALPLPRTVVRIQLSTLPVLVIVGPVLGLLWFAAGIVTVGVLGDRALEADVIETATVATLAVFCVEGGRTTLEYFYRQGYRDHSAQTVVGDVFWKGAVLFFVGLFTSFFAALADPAVATDESISNVDPTIVGVPLLVGIVLVKFGIDLAGVYRDQLRAFGKKYGMDLKETTDPPTHDDIDTSLETHRRVRPPVSGRLLATVSHAGRFPTAWVVGVFPAVFAILLAIGGVRTLAAGLATVAVAVPLLLLHVDYWLRYAGVEYRVDADATAIVASDRLFRVPLWHVDAWDESGVRLERDLIDRWLGTTTVVVERPDPDGDLQLPRLSEVEPILEVFDRTPDGLSSE